MLKKPNYTQIRGLRSDMVPLHLHQNGISQCDNSVNHPDCSAIDFNHGARKEEIVLITGMFARLLDN